MSLVNEAAVAAAMEVLFGEPIDSLPNYQQHSARELGQKILTAAAPHIGGEAIRQAVAAVSPEPGEATGDPYDKGFSNALRMMLKHAEVKP